VPVAPLSLPRCLARAVEFTVGDWPHGQGLDGQRAWTLTFQRTGGDHPAAAAPCAALARQQVRLQRQHEHAQSWSSAEHEWRGQGTTRRRASVSGRQTAARCHRTPTLTHSGAEAGCAMISD
jgi:hypothetical protein